MLVGIAGSFGFAAGVAFSVHEMLKSSKVKNAVKDIFIDKITEILYSNDSQEKNNDENKMPDVVITNHGNDETNNVKQQDTANDPRKEQNE